MVGLSGDSLQPLLTWRPGDPGPRPGFGGRGEDLRYMQGTVVAWDPDTAANVVRIRGTDHTNVPLIDLGIGQRSIQAGDQVAIMSWSPNGGTAAYFVMGRLVVPGTTAAARSADALSTMARDIAPLAIGARVHQAESNLPAIYTSDTGGYVAHSESAPAVLSDVEVSEAGTMIVLLGTHFELLSGAAESGAVTGAMSVDITGPTSLPPDNLRSVWASVQPSSTGLSVANMFVAAVEAGVYRLETRYMAGFLADEPHTVQFSRSRIVVIGL